MSGTLCPPALFPTIPRVRGGQSKPNSYWSAKAAPGAPSARKKSTTTTAATKRKAESLPPGVKQPPTKAFRRDCATRHTNSVQYRRDRQTRRSGLRAVRDAVRFGKRLVHGGPRRRFHAKSLVFPFGNRRRSALAAPLG